jgi:molybdopterin adenylyltransferase
MTAPKIGILTISDRATQGVYEDVSGPAIESVLREFLATACEYERRMVADEFQDIVCAIEDFVADGCALVCTTGGTGPSPRDVTPEAMDEVLEKELPGFGELMRRASLDAGVPTAILSRQTAGIVGKTLVVNVPGKPGSVRVCLDAIFPAIPYCIELAGGPYLEGNPDVVQVFRPKKG